MKEATAHQATRIHETDEQRKQRADALNKVCARPLVPPPSPIRNGRTGHATGPRRSAVVPRSHTARQRRWTAVPRGAPVMPRSPGVQKKNTSSRPGGQEMAQIAPEISGGRFRHQI